MARVVTFGEIMCRVEAEGLRRIRQALPGTVSLTFTGAEANVAASLALYGSESRYVTAIPDHAVGDALVGSLRGLGVDTQYILRRNVGRLGIFFVETGANQRPGVVVYDRDGATVALTSHDAYPWKEIFADADWFHVTGITPAISKVAAEATIASARIAKEAGLTVSTDLNFRSKLWNWEPGTDRRELAQKTMRQVLPYVDLVIGNEEDASDVLGIQAADTDVSAGKLAVDRYEEVASAIVAQFPNVGKVGITLRESISASWNNWGAVLYDAATRQAHFAPLQDGEYRPYEIRNIVDRVGAGDSFAAGLIYSLTTPELSDPETAIRFATAASCLAHSVAGDVNFSSRADVERLMGGTGSGRVVR